MKLIEPPGVVVRRFDRHRDVVRVTFLQARSRDLHELGLLQLLDGGRAGVAHRRTQAAGQLEDHRRQRPTERHPAFDALGHQLVFRQRVVLEVAVLGVALPEPRARPALHGSERAHAAVALELFAVDEDQLARRLCGAGQQRTQHRRRRARGQRLGDVAGVLQSPVGDHRHTRGPARGDGLQDRRDLRCADAGDHPGGADGTRAHTDLHRVGPGLDQRGGRGPGGDVAADHLDPVAHHGLELVDHVEHQPVVRVRGVHDQHVDAGVGQRHRPRPGVVADHRPRRRPAAGRRCPWWPAGTARS